MQHNYPIAPLSVALFNEGDTISPPVVASGPHNTPGPVTPSVVAQWHCRLLAVSDISIQPLLARLSDHALVAALRLLPPDFPMLAVLANLCGWEGL